MNICCLYFASISLIKRSACPPLVHQVSTAGCRPPMQRAGFLVEIDVAGETVPVAVEGETDEMTLAIENWRAAVAARDVVVGEETELHLACGLS